MQLKIIYDNSAVREDFQSGWGFSCLVDDRILFDTGEEPDAIFHNLAQLQVDFRKIEAVVISHDHWDHTGGLWALLEKRPGLRVFACPGFSVDFKEKVRQLGGRLIENAVFAALEEHISVTGEILGEYKGAPLPEQALVIQTAGGLVVITGCSHPGIVPILQKVKAAFPETEIGLALGGFHLKDADTQTIQAIVTTIKKMGVRRVGPTHCTGEAAQLLFSESFGADYISIHAGKILEI
jgi:7,8-dihydropterin-6-yl-methyl-4-(beta-D-ribofuranosyl)aminobenzene 5'-phosphate synthase